MSLYDDLEEEKALLIGCMEALETYLEDFNIEVRLTFPSLLVELFDSEQWVPVARLQVVNRFDEEIEDDQVRSQQVMIIDQSGNNVVADGFQCNTWQTFFEISKVGRNMLISSMITSNLT